MGSAQMTLHRQVDNENVVHMHDDGVLSEIMQSARKWRLQTLLQLSQPRLRVLAVTFIYVCLCK